MKLTVSFLAASLSLSGFSMDLEPRIPGCGAQWRDGFSFFVYEAGGQPKPSFELPHYFNYLDFDVVQDRLLKPLFAARSEEIFGKRVDISSVQFDRKRKSSEAGKHIFVFSVSVGGRRIKDGWVAVEFVGQALLSIQTHLRLDLLSEASTALSRHKVGSPTQFSMVAKERAEAALGGILSLVKSTELNTNLPGPVFEGLHMKNKKTGLWLLAERILVKTQDATPRYYFLYADSETIELLEVKEFKPGARDVY